MSVRSEAWTIYRQALPILLVSLLGGLFAGLVLEEMVPKVADFPGLLVMIPVFLATRGNVYGALGGRISSGLHQGVIEPRFARDDRLVNAVVASLVNAIGISIVIAVLTWLVLHGLGREVATLFELVAIMLISGVLTAVVLVAGLLGVIFVGFERGYDPDNLVGPVVTTLGDIFGMLFLLFAVVAVEVLVP
ncbi:MgtE integral membrane region [Halovivax asiaticus JCM 14624]|uniref:MgtE integral membrane region n=1 Tax=Halovivax asiaticus JCM 14624 TaxID=1227490 RepID=M0BR78_9EURY|nr:magnesium transporter [Halovivax asiaticus]ELZ13445.1 MgtE integral membrane region [Halovivax asiaticus JCM 14624]